MKTKAIEGSNGFNRALVLVWRGIAYRTCSCTWSGDAVHQVMVCTPKVKVRYINVEREDIGDVTCRGTVEVNWRQFCRFLRDAGIRVRRIGTSECRESAVFSTVIK